MAFTYQPDDLATPLNRLRFLVQDTTEVGRFFEDAEIEFVAEQETNIYRSAANLCDAIAAKLAKTPSLDSHENQIKFEAAKSAQYYIKLAEKYNAKADEMDASMKNATAGTLNLPTRPTCSPAFTRDLHFSSRH